MATKESAEVAAETYESLLATWDPSDPRGGLKVLYLTTVAKANHQINWYKAKVKPKRILSQVCRFLAIAFLGLAALAPLLKAAGVGLGQLMMNGQAQPQGLNPGGNIFELGYVFAAMAGGLLAFDKYFGLSSGWIRYIQTELTLGAALDELQYDWVALLAKIQGDNPTPDQVQAMIQRLRSFIVLVNGQTQKETEAWVMEFQSNLADLEKSAKARAEEQKPGRIEVTVSNAQAFQSVTASLDGMEARPVEGTSCFFGSVAPGPHIVLVKGTKDNKTLQASDIVRVQPDAVAAVGLALPSS